MRGIELTQDKSFFPFLDRQLSVQFLVALVFVLIFSIHLIRVAMIFSPEHFVIRDLCMLANYPFEFAAMERDRAFQTASGMSHGYDPSHRAGYLVRFTFDDRSRWPIFTDRFLRRWLSVSRSLYLTFFLSFLFSPLLLYFACRLLGGDHPASLLAMALGVAALTNEDFFSGTVPWNLVSLILVSYLSPLCIALFYKALQEKSWFKFALFFISILLFAFAQPLLFLFIIIPLAALFAINWISLPLRWKVGIALAMAIVLYVNRVLISVYINWASFNWNQDDVFPIVVRLMILAAFGKGLWMLWREKKEVAGPLVLWVFVLAIEVWLFSRVKEHFAWWTSRFLLPLVLTLIVPASIYISQRIIRPKNIWGIFLFWFLWFQMTWQIPSQLGQFNSAAENPPGRPENLVNKIRTLPRPGRILYEVSSPNFEIYDALPLLTGKEFVGIPQTLEGDREISFRAPMNDQPPMLFGNPLSTFGREKLLEFLERYNVSYVVAFSLQARSLFERYPEDFQLLFEDTAKAEKTNEAAAPPSYPPPVFPYRIYQVKGSKPSFLLEGTGQAVATFNRIVIQNPNRGKLVLKYHWFDSLQAPPGVIIRPKKVGNDPTPFISIINGSKLKEIIIQNKF